MQPYTNAKFSKLWLRLSLTVVLTRANTRGPSHKDCCVRHYGLVPNKSTIAKTNNDSNIHLEKYSVQTPIHKILAMIATVQ